MFGDKPKPRIKDNLLVGEPDVNPDKPTHVKGVNQGNARGNYESAPGHLEDGRSTARRSTGVRARHHDPIDPRMPNLSPA